MKDISIVLVNYYFKQDILQALLSLTQDISDCPYDVQITVVDNSNNADGLGKALHEQFPQVTYINACRNLGFGQGTTLGFKALRARYYFALNPDTFIPAQTQVIERLIAFMDNHPKIGCIGPKLVNMDGSIQQSCFRFDPASIFVKPFKQINWDKKYRLIKRLTSRLAMEDFLHDRTQPVDWVLGAALMVRDEVVSAIGWFDERYFMYLEDCDWCRTMWERGWSVYYVHDIIIKHRYTRQSAKVPGLIKALVHNRLARIHLKSWLKYMWKWRGQWKFPEKST